MSTNESLKNEESVLSPPGSGADGDVVRLHYRSSQEASGDAQHLHQRREEPKFLQE